MCSSVKDAFRNFARFTGKHLCWSLFFNKVAGLRPGTLLKKRLWHRSFLVNFVKFLRTPFFTEHLWTTVSQDIGMTYGKLLHLVYDWNLRKWFAIFYWPLHLVSQEVYSNFWNCFLYTWKMAVQRKWLLCF